MAIPYHPYYEALALYGVKLVGKSLRTAYKEGEDTNARTDMCMAAINGGICFTKGLGIGHAIAHVLGAHYHISHGKAVAIGLLCFVKTNKEVCQEQFSDLAWALDRSADLETALVKFYKDLNMPCTLKDLEIPKKDLGKIAFETSRDAANIASNPLPVEESRILEVLKECYQ